MLSRGFSLKKEEKQAYAIGGKEYNKRMKKVYNTTNLVALLLVFILFATALSVSFTALRSAVPVFALKNKLTVVLDAGHGGIDGGVSGKKTGVKESDINLSITLELKEILSDAGFEVVLTRKTQAGLYDNAGKGFKRRDMQKRKEIIEEAKPNLVLSIHQNYYPSSSTRGAQVFYSHNHLQAKEFAKALQANLNTLYQSVGAKPRTEHTGEYFILECTPYTSAIVECGFLSNPYDETLLRKENFRRKLASARGAYTELTRKPLGSLRIRSRPPRAQKQASVENFLFGAKFRRRD